MTRTIWLDITRLAERAALGRLTGIDRVELAYAQTLHDLVPDHLRFVMLHRWLPRFVEVPRHAALPFLQRVSCAWRNGRPGDNHPRDHHSGDNHSADNHPGDSRIAALRLLARSAAALPPPAASVPPIYLLTSHRHLHRPAALAGALRRSGAAFVPLVHDLIPLTHPEYARPGEAGRHARRIATVATLADAVIVNSNATGQVLVPYLPAACPIHTAPLGVTKPPVADRVPDSVETADRPYFLCVGTIEPRKNHLLLLHLWRRLADRLRGQAPRLVIVGARGWENENVLDLLDRCTALRGHVAECGTVPDRQLAALMRGARALLMPSFAEGFGLPVAEALALGTPVICSDLPALRETGGVVPEYLAPLDAPAWEAAIVDYATDNAPRRAAQHARMPAWRAASWSEHLNGVLGFLEHAVDQSGAARHRPSHASAPSLPTALDSGGPPNRRSGWTRPEAAAPNPGWA